MIIRERFSFKQKKDLNFGKAENASFISICANDKGIRLIASSRKRGDADIFLSIEEKNKLIAILDNALSHYSNEKRRFFKPLISPQLEASSGRIVNAVIHVVLCDRLVGISIDIEHEHGVELWLRKSYVQTVRDLLKGIGKKGDSTFEAPTPP